MSAENRERVIRLLETYHEREQKIALLNYELLHFPRASPNEVAEGMGLGHSCELTPHSGYISDKTFFISLNYQERASQINAVLFWKTYLGRNRKGSESCATDSPQDQKPRFRPTGRILRYLP